MTENAFIGLTRKAKRRPEGCRHSHVLQNLRAGVNETSEIKSYHVELVRKFARAKFGQHGSEVGVPATRFDAHLP